MKFKFCPDCGQPLVEKKLGDETGVPWCIDCGKPWFPLFPSAIIALIYNDKNEVLLLRQNYISQRFHNLVSGYIVPGESAEECAIREIYEETGIEVDNLQLVLTSWFAKKDIMMIGFFAHASQTELKLSSEVDSAEWMAANCILNHLSNNSGSTSRLLAEKYLQECSNSIELSSGD